MLLPVNVRQHVHALLSPHSPVLVFQRACRPFKCVSRWKKLWISSSICYSVHAHRTCSTIPLDSERKIKSRPCLSGLTELLGAHVGLDIKTFYSKYWSKTAEYVEEMETMFTESAWWLLGRLLHRFNAAWDECDIQRYDYTACNRAFFGFYLGWISKRVDVVE